MTNDMFRKLEPKISLNEPLWLYDLSQLLYKCKLLTKEVFQWKKKKKKKRYYA